MTNDQCAIRVEARDVPILHALALINFSCFSQEPEEGFPEMADDAAQVLDTLGWDEPPATGCVVRLRRPATWLAGLQAQLGDAVCGPLDLPLFESYVRLLGQVDAAMASRVEA